MARYRLGAIGAAALVLSMGAAQAQLDVRADPEICRSAVSPDCARRLGAGALAAPIEQAGRACAEQFAVYRACLAYASGGATAQRGDSAAQTGAGPLPLAVEGLLNPNQRDEHPFRHDGGCVQVSSSDMTSAAVVALRTADGVEIAKRTGKIGGGERVYTQFLPAGAYQLSVEARRKGTPYRAKVTALGDC